MRGSFVKVSNFFVSENQITNKIHLKKKNPRSVNPIVTLYATSQKDDDSTIPCTYKCVDWQNPGRNLFLDTFFFYLLRLFLFAAFLATFNKSILSLWICFVLKTMVLSSLSLMDFWIEFLQFDKKFLNIRWWWYSWHIRRQKRSHRCRIYKLLL